MLVCVTTIGLVRRSSNQRYTVP